MLFYNCKTSLSQRLTFGSVHKFRPYRVFYRAGQDTVDMLQVFGRQSQPGLRQLIDMIRLRTQGTEWGAKSGNH